MGGVGSEKPVPRAQCPGPAKAASATSSKAIVPPCLSSQLGRLCAPLAFGKGSDFNLVLIPVWRLGRGMVTAWVPQRLAFGTGVGGVVGGTGEPRSYCSWLGWCPVGLEGLGLGVRAGSELREPPEGGRGQGRGRTQVGRHWEEGTGRSLGKPQGRPRG